MEPEVLLPSLRDQLVDAASQPPRRFRTPRTLAALAVIAIVVAGLSWLRPSDAVATRDVIVDGTSVSFTIEHADALDGIVEGLNAAGVPATGTIVTTGPSKAGEVIVHADGHELQGTDRYQVQIGSQVNIQVLVLGDGLYQQAVDALAPGELFACQDLLDVTVTPAVADTMRATASNVTYLDGKTLVPVSDPEGLRIVAVEGISPTDVIVRVTDDPTIPAMASATGC